MSISNPIPCLLCGTELQYAGIRGEEPINLPSDGTAFRTYGHYGSTFFDPGRNTAWFEIAICDACLRAVPRERLWLSPHLREDEVG